MIGIIGIYLLSTIGIVSTALIAAKVTICACIVAVVDSAITKTVSVFQKLKKEG